MKKTTVIVMAIALLSGCGKKAGQVALNNYQQYQDPYFNLRFSYPASWQVVAEPERIYVYSAPGVETKFYAYSAEGEDGAMLVVTYQKMDTVRNLDQIIHTRQNELSANGFDISEVKAQALGGIPGTQLHYSGVIDAKTRVEGLQVQAVKDSFLYSVRYEAFNKVFPACLTAFDTLLATIQLPTAKAKTSPADESKPSEETLVFENNFLKLIHPKNFGPEFPKPKPPAEFSMDVKGYRQDSNVHIDILPAKGLTLSKVVDQNAKLFKEQSRGNATVDGVPAVYINYSPMAGIQSRVYFVVKNDKVYRIILNYYAPMKANFLPAFEKVVASLSTK
ncbi:MAG TPA: hypothetical protein VGB38_02575 [bacterium]